VRDIFIVNALLF